MIETRRLKNVVIYFPSNFKFCAIKKDNEVLLVFLLYQGFQRKQNANL